ncbi:MAG: endonuclease III [Nitrospirales bacterium]|nr:endonuclease III [Nitrospirales bacterium]
MRIVKKEVHQWPSPVLGVLAKQENASPFQILIACILSLRTKDQTTAEAASQLFSLAKDPLKMSKLKEVELERAIYPVGFYKTKARQIRHICLRLIETYRGKVPNNIEELLTLNGVGRKTANLVVTIGFRKPGICVDVHVHRICNRWGYLLSKSPDETEQLLRQKLPSRYWITFNDLLVPFGQNLCKPISPFCSRCSLAEKYCKRVNVTAYR